MRRVSVKIRMAILLTALMALLWGVLLAFMLSISSQVATRTAQEQLTAAVRANLTQVSLAEGKLAMGGSFHFYQNGVSTLVYSESKSLLAGQVPVSFAGDEAFQSGLLRTVSGAEAQYLVLDMWVPSGWENGLWVRGLLEVPESGPTTQNLLRTALMALPLFVLLAALGSYITARRAFRPLDRIIATAAAINEARDLSLRIGLPPGRDEFSRLADTFDSLFARLERSFEAEKQFTADASHELRTPVSIIKGACECGLKFDETEAERRETLSIIQRQADKMSQLIAQLLSMTRLEQGTEPARLARVDLTELARAHCQEEGYERLTLELEEGVSVRGDAGLLVRLLQNLIENAYKYGKPDGRVWVSVSRRGGEALLSVRDNGIGIPPEQQEKIWQRFYQVDAARSGEAGGAGLGLAMVRQIAQLHGGRMTVDSVPDAGSAFTLHLPPAEEEISEKT